MARGKPGADSSDIVTSIYQGKSLLDLARNLFGQDPVFWGRYFKGPGNTDDIQYQAAKENTGLKERGIRVLPIARQTLHVTGDGKLGAADAEKNAAAIFASFPIPHLAASGGEFYVFLDVEPNHPLSVAYYLGWASRLVDYSKTQSKNTVVLRPCVYLNQGDKSTCQTLNSAISNHSAECRGIWTAHYPIAHSPSQCIPLTDWSDSAALPEVPIPCPTLVWQYVGDCYSRDGHDAGPLDGSQVNPNIDLNNALLRFLIPPP